MQPETLSSSSSRRGTLPRQVWIAAAMLVALAGASTAQLQFDQLDRQRPLPAAGDDTRSLAFGDVDGDGDLDLVLASTGGQNRLYLNDGSNTGVFLDATSGRMPAGGAVSVTLGDVDGDGDLDQVFGSGGASQNRLYLNDGTGTFTDTTTARMPVDTDPTAAIALGDVDADGDLDMVLANRAVYVGSGSWTGVQNRLYLNDGAGIFTDATAARIPVDTDPTEAVALGDVDADGDLDLVLGNHLLSPYSFSNGVQNRLYLNDGTGRYADATSTSMPVDTDATASVALGDIDADGDLDMVLGNQHVYTYPISGPDRLYLNDGTGAFSDATASLLPTDLHSTSSVVLGDVDGDGDLDLVAAKSESPFTSGVTGSEQNRLYLNDGTGKLTDATPARMPPDRDLSEAVALGDVDGDGDLDIVIGNSNVGSSGQNRLYRNDGGGAYTDTTAPRMPSDDLFHTADFALGDVDGDGDLDMVLGNQGLASSIFGAGFPDADNWLYLNDGTGTFADSDPPTTVGRGVSEAVVLGDVDGDGDLDLIVGNHGSNELHLNDGTGAFTDATAAKLPRDSDSTMGLALGDVDGDGDLDLVLANRNAYGGGLGVQNRLYLNDGTGTFIDATATRLPVDSDYTNAVALGDVDGDGDLDLVVGNGFPSNRLYLNDGTGTFHDATATRLPVDSDDTNAVALGDVDGDGDLDLVFGNDRSSNRLYLNDGTGTYADATTGRLPAGRGEQVAFGDVDDDGDLDLVLAYPFGYSSGNRLYVNDGAGAFRDATASRSISHGGIGAVALGDLDGDGDLDLVLGGLNLGPNLLIDNLMRHLHAPLLLRTGHTYPIEVYARHAPAGRADVALPFLATGTASISVPPYGTFGLDPTQTLSLPPIAIPQPAGMGSWSLPVPSAPSLVGLPLHAQALLLGQANPGEARLTHVVSDVVGR